MFFFIKLLNIEETQKTISRIDIEGRLTDNKNKDDSWNVSFEAGVDPLDINDDALPRDGNENHGFLGLKLVHTQWRYDFGFLTPKCMSVQKLCI